MVFHSNTCQEKKELCSVNLPALTNASFLFSEVYNKQVEEAGFVEKLPTYLQCSTFDHFPLPEPNTLQSVLILRRGFNHFRSPAPSACLAGCLRKCLMLTDLCLLRVKCATMNHPSKGMAQLQLP